MTTSFELSATDRPDGPESPRSSSPDPALASYSELAGRAATIRGKAASDLGCGAVALVGFGGCVVLASLTVVYEWNGAFLALTAVGGLVTALMLVGAVAMRMERLSEADSLESQLKVLKGLQPGRGEETNYFEQLVNINVTNLRDYYFLVKVQTGRSFQAAMLSSVVGFAITAASLGYGLYSQSSESVSLAGTAAGIFSQFIGALFFALYSRSVRQLKEYHDSLLSVQSILLALKLLEEVPDTQAKHEMMFRVLSSLTGSAGTDPNTPKPA